MREHPEGAISQEDFEPLSQDLVNLGYSEQEIETALFWYHSRQLAIEKFTPSDDFEPHAFRILHDVERSIIRPEAYGYLIELKELGLISLGELDNIIEKSILLGGRKVDVEEIKTFVAAQIMEQDSNLPMPGLNFYLKTPPNRIQ